MSRPSVIPLRSRRSSTGPGADGARVRVMIVEDERIVAAYLELMLRELGYDAYASAPSASKALALAAETPPDVVLADIRIEGPVDGIETAAQLRKQYGAAIIFLTAHADDSTIERAKQAQPSGYLVKPITAPAVKAAVEMALDRRTRENSARAMEEALSNTSADLLSALNHLPLPVQLEDAAGRVVHTNPAYRELFRLTDEGLDLIGVDGALLIEHIQSQCVDPGRFAIIIDSLRRAGQPMAGDIIRLLDGRRLELDYIPIFRGAHRQGQLWTFRDISDTERTREELEQATARHRTEVLIDPLTQLTSRRGFFELAPTYLKLSRCARDQVRMLFFIDLDGLKGVNDHHGHAAGDEAICLVAQALRAVFRASDLIARLGGDEFVVLASLAASEAGNIRSRLGRHLAELGAGSASCHSGLSVSVGSVEYHPEDSLDEVVSRADEAMYGEKRLKHARDAAERE